MKKSLFVILLVLARGVFAAATLPTLPQSAVDTTYAYPTGATCTAANSAEFTACLNSAALNSVIVLNAGTTYSAPLGGFVAPDKTTGSGWIYIVSSQLASLPAAGTRVSSSHANLMPKIVASTANETALNFARSAHHYRLVGIELSPASGSFSYSVVQMAGGNYSAYPTLESHLPHHVIFDRVYVHGDSTQGARRGIQLEGANVAVIDSHISNIYDNGQYSCCGPADSQAIAAWTSPGPFKIHNNYLEAAGENVMFGGVDTSITNLSPSDITITRNHMFKKTAWATDSPAKQVKNLLELKHAKRVLIEGNVLENNYPVAQNGMGVLFTVRNQSGGNTWADVSDVTFRYNKLLNSHQGINIAGMDTEAGPSQRGYRIHIHDNFVQISNGSMCLLAQNQTSDIIVDHNYFQNCSTPGYLTSPTVKLDHFTYKNNLLWDGGNGFTGEGCGVGTSGLACHTTDYTFTKNAIINYQGGTYPAGNYYPASNAAVQFTNYAGGNYRLAAGSPYKSQGTDGKDLGPDWDALEAAIAGTGSTFTVTPSAGANGSISPNTAQTVNGGGTAAFTVTPNSGYTATVGGTCGGGLVGTTYTTNAIAANCTVSATFADTTAPTTPTDLDARSNSTSAVDLSWVASTDAVGVTSYRVDYCSGFGCSSWATLGTSATNSYTHTGITPATNPTIYRYRVYALDAANNLSGAATSIYFNAVPTIPAFPGAEGGGAASKGGRGGTVYHVTSLDGGTGAGTLRACVAASGPRTCVFDVAGNIELTGNINISLPYITIAGHTAPGGGITISGKNSTQVSLTVRTHNVTIRGIRIRKGYNSGTPDQDGDSVNVLSTSATASPVGPVIFDHVSISWGQDENAGAWALTTRAPKNITYQWVMMYEPLLAHPVNFMTGAYNNATAERMTDIDVHHSIFANSSHRNPLIKNKTFRLVNNLIYNWGDWASAIEGTVQADLIGNRYKTGPLYQTISSKAYEIQLNPTGDASTPTLGSPSLYVIGNVGLHNADPLADNWGMTRLIDIPINAGVELGPLSESYRRFTPLSALPFPITAQDVWTAETIVLAGAGASRRLDCSGNWVSNRDSADARVVVEYTAGNAGIIPANEDAVGGYPTLATGTACADGDGDGMPDTWETANGLNASSASDGPTLHASGYSNLEMYLAGSSSETTPVLSNLLPTSNLARTATSATLQATTDQTATCRYALGSGTPYAGMTPFSNTASTTHSSNVSIVAGGVYQYCVRCMGTSLVSDESCTRFAVDPNPKKRVRH